MTELLDGPAAGARLMLKRAPFFLRVVDNGEKIDALDQPDDKPAAEETIFAYYRVEAAGMVHINMGRKGGGFYPMAKYRRYPVQPDDYTMRDTALWRAWTVAAFTGQDETLSDSPATNEPPKSDT